jgi:hypothetical protein
MAVDLICPDCGGIIGATDTDAEGRGPCMCLRENGKASGSSDSSSDTVSIPAPPPAQTPANPLISTDSASTTTSTGPAKFCIKCGKDVSGHRRVKDSRGYMCYACAKGEIHEEKAGTIPCAGCKRRVKEAGLIEYKGRKLCKICLDHEKEIERKNRKVSTKEIDEHEKRNIIILAVIFGILALIILVQTIRHFLS